MLKRSRGGYVLPRIPLVVASLCFLGLSQGPVHGLVTLANNGMQESPFIGGSHKNLLYNPPTRHQALSEKQLISLMQAKQRQLQLSHQINCEPISQLDDLKLVCQKENQFIVVLEAYYSDLYPEIVCPKVLKDHSKYQKLTGSQLVAIFRQLYSPSSPASTDKLKPLTPPSASSKLSTSDSNDSDQQSNRTLDEQPPFIKFNPTLNYGSQRPFCIDDLKQSVQAKCSGRQSCSFSRQDHQFPHCAQLKPGHVFLRYLCIDDSLLVRYCNSDALLASHSSVLNRVRRSPTAASSQLDSLLVSGLAAMAEPPPQVDTPDFGFVASPGYPNFYATPRDGGQPSSCGWTIEAELGQRITIKLMDASLAPNLQVGGAKNRDFTTLSSLVPEIYDDQASSMTMAPMSHQGSNLYFEELAGSEQSYGPGNQRLVFKIDQLDYELIRKQLFQKLKQVADECQDYDQLIVHDSSVMSSENEMTESETMIKSLNNNELPDSSPNRIKTNQKLDLITKLPITLYRNNLIDFNNQTIYHGPEQRGSRRRRRRHNDSNRLIIEEQHRIDYQALIENLNPLQLMWLYQHNVSLCSMGQLDNLSSAQDRRKMSFTSTGHTIQLDLISGHMFNPTNRGVLFWYHKHGCPATLKLPTRSRLVYRNETTEVFRCLDGFVFNDTRSSVRVRNCDPLRQIWRDYQEPQEANGEPRIPPVEGNRVPGCVYVEDIASQLAVSHEQASAKFHLVEGQHPSSHKLVSDLDAAVEVVGVPTPESPSGAKVAVQDQDSELQRLLASNGGRQGDELAARGGSKLAALWYSVIDYISLRPTGQPLPGDDGIRSITTHLPLREQRLPDGRDGSFITRLSALFDRRLLVPAITVLFLFVLINFVIYVIFLIALPRFARLLCGSKGRTSPKRQANGYHYAGSSLGGAGNTLSHYESDYSVTMGMSL